MKVVSYLLTKIQSPLFHGASIHGNHVTKSSSILSIRKFSSSAVTSDETRDLVIIGGGPGGYVAAIKAAQLGLSVSVIEKRGALGGTCLNIGCIPSKALLHSSHLYEETQTTFESHGIIAPNVTIDLPKMMKQKMNSVSGLTKGIEGLFKKNKVKYIKGFGSLVNANEVAVKDLDGNESQDGNIKAKNIMIATGSDVMSLPNVPIDEERIVSSTGALELKQVPEKMIVIGGGVIGLEMGSVWRRLGAEVTVVEYLDRICPSLDAEIGKEFLKILKKQKMKFKLNTKVTSAQVVGDKVELAVESSKGEKETMDADIVLVAIGRKPYTSGLGLEKVGVTLDSKGRIEVDECFRSSVPNIYAIGDVIRGPMLAHKAEDEGIVCVEHIAGGPKPHLNYDAIPGVIYTEPEVADVGKTEEQLKDAGVDYKKAVFPFMANSRARANETASGMVKILTDAKTDRVLGMHIIGKNAGELIHEGCLAMEYGASAEDLARTCHAHPTLSEALREAAMAASFGKPIHF
eukprot:CAMPEP_0182446304 /NCGR_PEP_ID=MMETSP1172-20130603/4121_1 /TAXON_ID=708627 /ORGANISM="Timspurckia oligopyrenoides, Strain CCMP3278" /LENGTH=516 /DNA_ID=CAMNT_0024642217 /DNA_START=92 /DNA_END=1642 /DNA_ORIENTATION=+